MAKKRSHKIFELKLDKINARFAQGNLHFMPTHTHTHIYIYTHFVTKTLFANNISNKGFIHKLHKEHIQLNIQEKKKTDKNGKRI